MKRKYLKIFTVALLVLTIIGFGVACMPPSATTAAPATPVLTQVQADIVKLQQDVQKKAEVSQFEALRQQLATTDGKINAIQAPSANSYPKSETYSKAEVDKAVTDAITKLKSDQTWITASTTTPQNPYGTPTPVTPVAGGTVTMTTSPSTLPTIFSGAAGVNCNGTTFSVNPTGYVQPYTMRITNSSTAIQYVRPIITISTATTGGFYYTGSYPQLIYFNLSISTGYGMVQGSATSNFCGTAAPVAPCTQVACSSLGFTNCATPINGFCPIAGFVTTSTSNPSGGFPINLSPSNANVQPTPSFSFTPTAPALNGYGEFQMTPGQTMDILITIQVATLQQATLQISNSISARQ